MQSLAAMFAQEPELILAWLEAQPTGVPDLPAVLAAARQALAAHPDYADLHYYTAHAAARAGRGAEALRLLDRALQINPHYRDARLFAARLCRGRQPRRALAHLRAALAAGADYADVHVTLGELWHERHQPEHARRAFRRALKLNPELAPARAGLAALAVAGDAGGADELPA